MEDRLVLIEKRYEELNRFMADPAVATDPEKLRAYAQEQAEISPTVQKHRELAKIRQDLESTREMLTDTLDEELKELAREEIVTLEQRQTKLEEELRLLLLPKDPNDSRNVIMEIRAGAGGDEAGLFASDLHRMYTRYAENRGWSTEVISANETGVGGFKEIIFLIKGRGVYSRLKFESGVHRVQRVPVTEASGRIHTSTATVVVLPEVDEVEVSINPDDIKMDVYRSSGPGGQHMQKNATAVRITHLPTGIVASCESERSQLQNRMRAMAVLRARLYAMEEQKRQAELEATRRSQVGTGERSEKIRTYNFPQNRITDHRLNQSIYRLEEFMLGDINEFIEALIAQDQAERLQAAGITPNAGSNPGL